MDEEYKTFDIPQEELLNEYYKLRQMSDEYSDRILAIVLEPQNIIPYMNFGRLVKVNEYGWGMVVRYEEKRVSESFIKSINRIQIELTIIFIFIYLST